jgi:anaerobic ribonucleoside-triphosphate reductase activating protein
MSGAAFFRSAERAGEETASEQLRLHAFIPSSRANGPGRRAVLWTQGCSLGCPGCFNPETHSLEGGDVVSVDSLFMRIVELSDAIEGITISGGEPLQQWRPVTALLERIRHETTLSSILFTGYRWDELQRMPCFELLVASVDLVIAGRYNAAQRLARGLVGSANKTLHFLTKRYRASDLAKVPDGELLITNDGTVLSSGIEPVRW